MSNKIYLYLNNINHYKYCQIEPNFNFTISISYVKLNLERGEIMNLRLAKKEDLNILETMYNSIIDNMNRQNIRIWHPYYPFEEFEFDIEKNNLYIIEEKNEIICAFCVSNSNDASQNFEWSDPNSKAVYLSRLGVNTNHLKKGVASKALNFTKQIAFSRGAKFIRLMVAIENTPATNLYLKNGFTKVNGTSEEFAECLNKTITEYGYELPLKKCSNETYQFINDITRLTFDNTEDIIIKKGNSPILFTSIHSMTQTKEDGSIKPSEAFTKEVALYLAEKCGVSCMIKNSDTGFDPNRTDIDEFKTKLKRFIKENNIKLVLDLHGAKLEREFDVELGTMNNLSADFSTIMELKEAFEENGINIIEINSPFKGGKLTQSIFFETNAEVVQIETNYKHRNIHEPDKIFRFTKCLEIFIKQFTEITQK